MKKHLKKIIVIAVLIVPALLQAQSFNFHIKGQLGHLSAPAKAYIVYIDYLSHTPQLDSAAINNGSFTITGTSDQIKLATIYINRKGTGLDWQTPERINLYVEAGAISVTATDFIQNAKISGGPLNTDYNKLNFALEDGTAKINKLQKLFETAPSEKQSSRKFIDSLNNQRHLIALEEQPIYLAFIKTNPASMISLNAVLDINDDDDDVKDLEAAFNMLSAEVRASKRGVVYAVALNQMKKTAIGAVAPDFTLADTLGKAVSLHDFKGHYVFVDFWASWCVPCRRENPNVLKAFNSYKEKNFTVISVSLDASTARKAWLKAIHEDNLPWTQISGLNGFNSDAAQLYGIKSIPQNFLVDPDGKIVSFNLRGDKLINKLQELLGK